MFYLSSKLYKDTKLSLGQTAEMVSLSKKSYIELLSKQDFEFYDLWISELKSNISNA